jgi:hypothetical protein
MTLETSTTICMPHLGFDEETDKHEIAALHRPTPLERTH